MNNHKLINTLGIPFATLGLIGCFLFFTSASTQNQSNSEAIAELRIKQAQVTEELNNLRANALGEVIVSSEPFLGEITMFAGNFAPRGWQFCNGQLLSINQNLELYSLLGTIYGGDGRTTFGLPDMRGRVPVHAGNGPGLSPVAQGQHFGQERQMITPSYVQVAGPSEGSGEGNIMAVSNIPPDLNVMQPSLGVNFIIAIEGSFPARN